MKKVSIVIPLYKSERYLKKLLESLIHQIYNNLEIILVDDGSPDNSGLIADQYAEYDSRIKVIHKENSCACEARNVGLNKATGDYLMFADGDDWLELDCVQYLVDILEKGHADMSMTDSIFTTRDREQNKLDNIRIWDNKQAVAGIINTFFIPIGPWNKLYSMRIIRDNNISFSVAWFGEELYFSTMAAMYSRFIAVGHRKIYNYRLNNPNSGCTKREVKNAINSLNNILYIKEKLVVHSEQITQVLNWHIWSNYFNLICYILGADEKKNYLYEYNNAKKQLKHLMPKVLTHDMLSLKDKIKIIIETFWPQTMANYINIKAEKSFEIDIME